MNKKQKFRKILVSNRGEIALRAIRACRSLGISVVIVYSTADEHSLAVKLADEAVCIGPPPAQASYLNVPQILSAADMTGADAIYPGYGFLSENASFAKLCKQCHIAFIGPGSEQIEQMSVKTQARKFAQKLGIPVLGGAFELCSMAEEAVAIAQELEYPLMLKAAFGGGGRGIQVVENEFELKKAFPKLYQESKKAFGRGELYLERFLKQPRHIEVQVIADQYGEMLILGERDCSIQRRYQKVVEEAPCPKMTSSLREKLFACAKLFCKELHYSNVGTLEFLVEGEQFYFMEMNTRIQVEHPVTEMLLGVDLVQAQIQIALGKPIHEIFPTVVSQGHTIEVRLLAEDPDTFVPACGKIEHLHFPGGLGVRVDSHIYMGEEVLPFYDPLLAKIIVHGKTRTECIRRLAQALEECVLEGLKTNLPLLKKIIKNLSFQRGHYHTHFLNTIFSEKQLWKPSKTN